MVELNHTPVRTSRNFKINSIEFDEKIPSKINKFQNLKVSQETGKDEIILDADFSEFEIKYGSGLLHQIREEANQKIKIHVKSIMNKEIKIEFRFDEKNLNLVDHIEIIAEENTSSNIYIIYRKEEFEKAYHNGLIRILAKKNSKVIVNILNLMNEKSSNILSIDGKIENNANLKFNLIDFGGKNSITNLYSNLYGEKANNSINSIYLGTNQEKIDMNYIAELYGEKSNINMDVQGALKDEAIKHFKGTIDFKKGCKKSTR